MGVPLSLLHITPEDEFCVLEMGASRVGEIRAMCDIAQPEAGILTAISPAHLDEFGSLDNVMQAKGELIEAISEQGFAVINGDDERCRALTGKSRGEVILVGEHAFNDVVATHVEHHNGKLSFRIDRKPFQVAAAGRHLLTSALATIAVARQIQLDDELIASGLAKFEPIDGRCRPLSIGDWTVIDDTYNASPASMVAACRLLADWHTSGKKLLCLGDMLALGGESDAYHRQLGAFISRSAIDHLIAVGEGAILAAEHARAGGMDPGCIGICLDDAMAHFFFDLWLEPGDVILVKGSRGMGMERFIAHLSNLANTQEVPLRKSA
jgi:UDP-N-acetylmuramoyl-tripeptide--D-alanyl-D-alanine ligase